jgi:hypothetical protein
MLLWEVLDGLHYPAFSINADFMITDSNTSVKTQLFFDEEEIVNLSVFDIISIPSSIEKEFFTKKSTVLEGRCFQKDRETFPAKITFIKHTDGFIVVVKDMHVQHIEEKK